MATLNLRRFSRPEGLKAIRPAHLLALFAPYAEFFEKRGVKLPEAGSTEDLEYDALASVFMQPDTSTPERLLATLYFIDEMATATAMDDLLSRCAREGVHLDGVGEQTPADVAVQVWLQDPGIVQRAHAEQQITLRRSFEYFRTLSSPVPEWKRPSRRVLEALEKNFDDWFERKRRGRGSKIFVFSKPDGIWILVRHGSPMQRAGVLKEGASSSVVFRPEVYDVLVYDPAPGEIRMNTDPEGAKELYRTQIGRHVFGDEGFFAEPAKYTLEPLRTLGVESLACTDIDGIDKVTLREIEYWWGGGANEVEIRRADDVFAAYASSGRKLPARAKIGRAKLEVKFSDAPSPRMVNIRLPKRTTYVRDDDSAVLETFLRKRGFIVDA